jgi:hypothetical protein
MCYDRAPNPFDRRAKQRQKSVAFRDWPTLAATSSSFPSRLFPPRSW